jgi:hypothetical protein
MTITHYIIALLLCCCASAFARIGETLEQCKQRYGQPYKTTEQAVYFRKAPFHIAVIFYQGKAICVGYRMIEENALGKGTEISDNEIEQLLKFNGADRQWKRREVISMWYTLDGQLFAHYDTWDHYLGVATKEWFERIAADTKQKEDKALEGF